MNRSFWKEQTYDGFLTIIFCLSVEELNLPYIGLVLDVNAKPFATSTEVAHYNCIFYFNFLKTQF